MAAEGGAAAKDQVAVKNEANATPREISRRGGCGKGLNGSEVLAGGAVSGRQTDAYQGRLHEAPRNICAAEEIFKLVPEWFFVVRLV